MFGHYITYHDIKVSYPDIIIKYADIKLSYPFCKFDESISIYEEAVGHRLIAAPALKELTNMAAMLDFVLISTLYYKFW